MIPIKLQLKNFISYGPQVQTVNFEPYNFICLSGKNGHGKSALLDAITWAVWGQARKISTPIKADEGILRLGQTQMMVALDFLCNGVTYRVRREYSIAGGQGGKQFRLWHHRRRHSASEALNRKDDAGNPRKN